MATIWDNLTQDELIQQVQRLTAENEQYRQALNSNGTDLEIAQDLFDRGRISEPSFVVWKHKSGHEPLERSELWRRFPRPKRTLFRWAQEVRLKIIERRQELAEGRLRYAKSVASGSEVWQVADNTAQGKQTKSSWDTERLQASGARDRW